MSVFAPLDPRGPDQRRKQLVAKLAQQASATQNAAARIPVPGRLGSMMSEGRAFRGAGAARLGGRADVTQAPNILQSVLARLGVLGHSHSEEMSAGRGLPIAPPAPSAGMPIPSGSPIHVPGNPGTPVSPSPNHQPVQPSFDATAPGQSVPAGTNAISTPGGSGVVDPGFLTGSAGPVPLGNGLYYDPASGMILGQQDVNPSAPRGLPGTRAAV
jgi:hypothetical protein